MSRVKAQGAFELFGTHVQLTDGADAISVSVGPDFRRRLARSKTLRQGRLVGAVQARRRDDLHPTMWEMHPAGDELLYLLAGAVDVILDEPRGERTVALHAGSACIVPRGVWHRLRQHRPSDLLFITRGAGSQLRPVERPMRQSAAKVSRSPSRRRR